MIMGSSGVFIKYLQLPTAIFTSIRMVVPAFLLFTIYAIKGQFLITKSSRVILLASTLNAIRLFFFVLSFAYTSIGNAVIILYTWPVFATLFERIILKEKIKKANALLLTLPFAGVVILFSQQEFSLENRDIIGMSSMLFAACIFALSVILFKKESHKYSGFQTVFYQNMVGGIVFLPVLFISDYQWNVHQITGAIIFACLLGVFAFGLFFTALKMLKASTVSFLAYLEVVFAIFYGYFFFDETITWNMMLGGILIIVSSILLKKE
jgi:drug/metabolite transporter (DMT)-like permease